MSVRAWLLAAAGCAAVFLAATTIGPTADVSLTDVPVYAGYARGVLDGASPYTGLGFEYPPLALVPILAGAFNGTGPEAYELGFGVVAGLLWLALAAAAGWLAAALASGRRAALLAVAAVAAAPLLTGAQVRTHFDALPAALALAGVAGLAHGRRPLGFALLGAGAMAKGWPLLLAAIALAWLWGRAERRAALTGALAAGAVVVACSLPFASSAYVDAYRFHMDRPAQIESTPAVLLQLAGSGDVTGTAERPSRWRSQGIEGGASDTVLAAFAGLQAGALVLILLLAAARPEPRSLVLACIAGTLAFVVLGKVLSPQFVIWLVPWMAVALVLRERLLAGLLAAALLLTQAEFPSRYWDLVAGDGAALAIVAARNGVLLAALALVIARLAAPARSRPPAAATSP